LEESEEKGKKWLTMQDIKRIDIADLLSIPTGYDELDKKLIGLFAGELTVLSGGNASGKTSWLNCLALNVINKGFKTAVWSGEMQDWRFQGWLNQMAAGKNYVRKKVGFDNLYYAPKEVCEKINNWTSNKLFLYNNSYGSKWFQLFNDIKEIVDKESVQLVIIDNLAALSIDSYDSGTYANQTKFILDLKDYAKQKNIHVVLVAHPRKQNDFLRKESISGTADLTNIADNVFIIHRVGQDFAKRAGEFLGETKAQQYMNFSNVLEVAKNRQMGIVDHLVGMYYEVESRRLKNSIAEHVVYGWAEEPTQAQMSYNENVETISDSPFEPFEGEAPF
jgi:archaellum biogenesis ATPase FlaH